MSHIKPLSRKRDIVVQEFNREILIYDLRADKAFHLNQTSALVWQFSDGYRTISEIAENLTQKLNSPVNEEFVWLALKQLEKEKLLENRNETADFYKEVSRREVVKRAGLTTLAALPLVSSIAAPPAAAAQSSACNTAAPGGVLCRCFLADAPAVGDNCGTNYAVGDFCNPGCSCRRTSLSCPTTGPLAGTCQGNCV